MARISATMVGAALAAAALCGCATHSVTFATNKPAKVSLVSLDDLNAPGTPVGDAPATVDLASLKDRVVKISADGYAPVYWATSELEGTDVKTRIDLQELPPSKKEAAAEPPFEPEPRATNVTHRLLMQAYQALTRRDLKLAMQLADRLAEIAPDIAAPLIIKGIALMQDGRRAEANRALVEAKTLDPEDTAIDELIKVTR